jgi:hypothetical protein
MPIDHENLTLAASLLTALQQRHDAINQLATRLASPTVWRSVDGSLSVPIPPEEVAQLENIIRLYLDECLTLHTTLRAMLAHPQP